MGLQDEFYARSPILIQNLLVSLRGASFRLQRSNDKVMRHELEKLMKSESLSKDERRSNLNQRLRPFLKAAVESTPYYRTLFKSGAFADIWRSQDPFGDFSNLPLLDKARVRGSENEFYSEYVKKSDRIAGFTSGTTGTPMKCYETQISVSRRFAFVARLRSWAGLETVLHPRRAQFTGRAICQETGPYWRHNFADNALLFSTVHIGSKTLQSYLEALRKFKPKLVDGYPTALYVLVQLAKAEGIELPRVPVAITSAETLTRQMREEIAAGFGARVFNQYAASEPSCFWSDCEFGNMHIHEEYGVSEILGHSQKPVGPGEIGEVVVTSLLNPAMPLVRYRTGDLARRGPDEPCPCGRTLARISEVIGRTDDILFTASRGYVGRLDPAFKGVEGIIESQIIQETLNCIRLLVVPDPSLWGPHSELNLVNNLKAKLGQDQTITTEIVSQVPRGANGKFQSVISLCRNDYPLDIRPY